MTVTAAPSRPVSDETDIERNLRLYECPLDHTPNAETVRAFQEKPIGPFKSLEAFFFRLKRKRWRYR